MTPAKFLMTIDEARAAFASSALELARSVDCEKARLLRMLEGRGNATGLGPAQRDLLASHRRLVRALRFNGLDWVMTEEMDGIRSYLDAVQRTRPAEAV